MTARVPEFAVRRLLVAVDASAQSLAALEAAAELAARFGAEMEGVFVEDVDLIRLAELPIARFVDPHSAAPRAPDAAAMTRALRAAADRARRALEEAADRERVRARFRIARGRVVAELLAAAAEADLVCLGAASGPGEPVARVGRTASAVVAGASGAVMVVRAGGRRSAPVVVLYDRSPAGRRALAATGALARHDGGRVVVLVAPDAALAGGSRVIDAELRREAVEESAALAGPGLSVAIREIASSGAADVAAAVRDERAAALVLPASSADAESLAVLLRRSGSSVLVVR